MKARLYFAAVLFSCARVCVDLGLTQISLFFRAHTDPTDPTEFARLMLNLTDALRSLASSGSHRFNGFNKNSLWKFVLICGRKNTPI